MYYLHHIRSPFVKAVLAMTFSCSAHAQPDAGALLQQVGKEPQPTLPRKTEPPKPLEPAPIKAPSGLSVTVKAFRFSGNTLMSAGQLAPAVASYIDRPLGMTELQQAAAAVADAYRQAGWIVRAYLPQQEIHDGIVTIQILEAVFAGAVIDGEAPQRFSRDAVLRMIEAAQGKGEHLNAKAIERALLLLDDLPGIAAAGSMRAGRTQGETELALKLADEPLLRSEVGIDNTGSRATGPERILANLNVNSPLGKGDAIAANAVHTAGSDYLRLAGSLPLGNDGWRAGVSASYLSYNLVTPEFLALKGKGTSDTVGLDLSYPLIRSRMQNLYFSANADRKNFDNQTLGATTTRYRTDTLALGLNGNYFDNLGGGGANSASVGYIDGNLNLDGSPNRAADALTTRTAGRYGKLRYALSRQQAVTDTVALYAAFSGQRASKNLDSSEKFYLGGAGGVRAYPSSEAGGADGQMLNLEARWKFFEGYSLIPFYDWGHVRVNRDNNFAGAPTLNAYSLLGTGVALGWQADFGMTAKLTWARRIGSNPNPTATGQDQDGSRIRDRLWASVMLPF